MKIIKINITFLFSIFLMLFIGCEVDYKDIDTLGKADSGSSEININLNLFVSGSWIPGQVATTEEMKVEKYDIFVFKVSSEGNYLEYKEMAVIPDVSENVSYNQNVKIGNRSIVLPSGGTKRVIVVANAGNNVTYPALCAVAESSKADLSDVTLYENFVNAFVMKADRQQSSPFVLVGNSLVANADGENVSIVLAAQYTKINIRNKAAGSETNGLFISSVQLNNVPESAYPLINDYSNKTPRFINYEVNTVNNGALEEMIPDKLYLLYTPGTGSSVSTDYRVTVLVKGKKNGIDFEEEFPCSNPMYPGYLYDMNLSLSGDEIEAVFVPNWSDGNFSISGVHLVNNKMTFPFTADKYWGYEITYSTDMAGTVVAEKLGNETWYNVTVEDNLVRVCCLEDNASGTERTASFTISLGKKKERIDITQQSMPSTIMFNGMEWLDRNLGATLPSTEENMGNSNTYGYYYQWGRNIPFPTFGAVTVVSNDPALTIQEAHNMKEFITGTSDWYTAVAVSDKTTTWDDRTGSLGNPCPDGYHVPSYREYQTILPYKNSAGIGNFANMSFKVNTGEILDDSGILYDGLYVTSGKEEATIYAIKKYQTEGAYYLRLRRIKTSSGIYLRIDRLPGNEDSDYAGETAAAKLATAEAVFNSATTGMETIYFPATGRRDKNSGDVVNQGINLYSWAATCWSTSSSGIYFDPITGNTRIYCIAQPRAFGQTVRCIKNY